MKADGANGSQKLMVVKLSQTRKAKFTAKEVQLLFVFETTPQILWQTILLVISNKSVRPSGTPSPNIRSSIVAVFFMLNDRN